MTTIEKLTDHEIQDKAWVKGQLAQGASILDLVNDADLKVFLEFLRRTEGEKAAAAAKAELL